jgi:pimeloyl-ACP methyl ester carboxylesterase
MLAVPPASHAFVANGLRLVVHDWGGHGSPVLLAHPTGFHGRVWSETADALVGAGHKVWSFDFHGHGDSDVPPVGDGTYSWDRFADDVLAVTDHLELRGRPDLVVGGHSKGGAALLLAEAKAPRTYARIWTYEPIVFAGDAPFDDNGDFVLVNAARKRRSVWPSRDEAFESYASKPPLHVMTPESLRTYVDYGMRDRADGTVELKCPPEVEAAMYAMAPHNGVWKELPNIEANVLVACGELSRSIDPELARRIADRLPHGRLQVFPGLGHFGPEEDPSACAASLHAFGAS